MSQSTEARNKAIVLEAFDTLFNKRDYVAAARFWSPNYMQHSAHIEPGRDGLFNLIKGMPATFSETPIVLAFATASSTIFCASSEEMLCFLTTLAIGFSPSSTAR